MMAFHIYIRSLGRNLETLVYVSTFIFFVTGCATRAEDGYISMGESNTRIAAVYLYKDSQCGVSHQVSIPVMGKAKTEDLELCMLQILSTDCSIWNGASNIPAACLAILVFM